jgi:hypothetical protein
MSWDIGGSMQFSGGGANAMQGLNGSPYQALSALGSDYASAYNSALSNNQQMYNNILSGYQQTMNNQVSAENQVSQGYGTLYRNVLGAIKGIGTSESQSIADAYAQQQGQSQQQMINAGLGNSTVLQSQAQGNLLQEQKAQVALTNQTQGLTAGYMSQLGSEALQYQNQAIQQNTGLASEQLGFMNSVMMPYPNAGLYAQLAQGYGAAAAANAARGQLGGGGVVGAPNFTQSPTPVDYPSIAAPAGGGGGYSPYGYQTAASPYSGTIPQGGLYSGGMDEYTSPYNNPNMQMFDPSAGVGTA